ncbi:IclR family transcriptional regulator [Desulfotruncus alcoholivorax]|uniref:IclR family transcriptional regulator n=1 Tax=Desulfotruncus alcoholivorax TaxID=265477 RepID=UPI000414A8EB|nr:IclR family transcriptional regulator [Desulfotruncus alcoholivorax]
MNSSKSSDRIVQSVERALKILEALGDSGGSMSINEISEQVGLHKSTVHRLLGTLGSKGFVQQEALTMRYKLGVKVLELSNKMLSSLDVWKEALPYMQRLANTTGEAIHLAIINDYEVVYIGKVEGTSSIPMYSQIGKRAPVHCTAVGKVILSHFAEDDMRYIISKKGLTAKTERTIVDVNQFLNHLEEIRKRGYAIDDEEHEIGIRCVAAPIRDYRCQVIAALSITGSVNRLSRERISEMANQVREAANLISRRLGCSIEMLN